MWSTPRVYDGNPPGQKCIQIAIKLWKFVGFTTLASVERAFGSRTCLARKGFTESTGRWHTGQQPGTKSTHGPAEKLRVIRWFWSPIGLRKIFVVLASKESSRTDRLRFPGRQEGRSSPWRTDTPASRPTPPRPASPRPVPDRRWYRPQTRI